MNDGQKIIFGSEGHQEPNVEAGDIIFVIEEKEHHQFKWVICLSLILSVLSIHLYIHFSFACIVYINLTEPLPFTGDLELTLF